MGSFRLGNRNYRIIPFIITTIVLLMCFVLIVGACYRYNIETNNRIEKVNNIDIPQKARELNEQLHKENKELKKENDFLKATFIEFIDDNNIKHFIKCSDKKVLKTIDKDNNIKWFKGGTLQDYKQLQADIKELVKLNFFALKELIAEFNLRELLDFSFKAKELRNAGIERDAGRSLYFNKTVFQNALFTKDDFVYFKFRLEFLKDINYTLQELKDLGYTINELKEIFTLQEFIDLGYTLQEFKNNDFTAKQLKEFYTLQELKNVNFTLEQLRDASFTLQELKEYFTISELDIYFTMSDLKENFKLDELVKYIPVSKLKISFTVNELMNHFLILDLVKNGLTKDDFEKEKIKISDYGNEFIDANIDNLKLFREKGFKANEIFCYFKKSTQENLKKAGFEDWDIDELYR